MERIPAHGAERLREIRGRHPHAPTQFRLMKSFTYGTNNVGSDLQLGKLTIAARYNYDPESPSSEVYKVSELYWYGDHAGRKTRRATLINKGFGRMRPCGRRIGRSTST